MSVEHGSARRIDPFLLVLAGATVLARFALAWSGVHLDMSAFGAKGSERYWQLLDPSWLRHDLWSSVWSLTMQPPLYNLAVGLWLHLPGGWQTPVAAVALTGCFLAISLATYATMVLLGVARGVAFVATLVLVVANPGQALFTTVPFYAEPTAALVTVTVWLAVRCVRRPTTGAAAWFSGNAATTALFNTSIQPVMVLIAIAIVLVGRRSAWRAIVLGSLVPCVALVGWSTVQFSRVGTPATSTWLGMNLTHVTFNHAPVGQLHRLVAEHRITKIATLAPFAPLSAYGIAPVVAGPAASAMALRPDGQPNFNNRAYATVSSRYLHDELTYLGIAPGHYATMVSRGLRIWAIPEDQYSLFFVDTQITGWENVYDNVVMLQGLRNRFSSLAEIAGEAPPLNQLSFTLIATSALSMLGTPLLMLCWRRRPELVIGLAVPWFLLTQAFIVTSLSEFGENDRFRFETGTTMITLSVVVLSVIIDRLRGRRRPGGLDQRLDALGWSHRATGVDPIDVREFEPENVSPLDQPVAT